MGTEIHKKFSLHKVISYEGRFLKLRCGVHQPVVWRKKGGKKLNTRFFQIDNYLIIKNVTVEDRGIYHYFGLTRFNDPYQETFELTISGNLFISNRQYLYNINNFNNTYHIVQY